MDGWWLPDSLAQEAVDHLGVDPPVDRPGVDELVEALGRHMPRGSTVKLEAVAQGVRPPGHDPAEIVERWLRNSRAAWTCWAAATVTAALVRAGGVFDAEVRAVRRCGEDAPPVDFHSVVGIVGDGERWICDPHFGVGTVPGNGGERLRPALRGTLRPRHDGRFDWTIAGPSFSRERLPYRSLTGPLDPEDVRAFCDLSVTHSGVSRSPFALLLLPDGYGTLRAESWTGPADLRLWRVSPALDPEELDQPVEPERHLFSTWAEGMDRLHAAAHEQLAPRPRQDSNLRPSD